MHCIAGNFHIENGQAQTRQFYIDSSSVRAEGRGDIDLAKKKIHMDFKPRPKKTAVINLSTPIEVEGKLEKPKIRVDRGGLVKTGLRLYFWFITFWEGVLRKQIPEYDFVDFCYCLIKKSG